MADGWDDGWASEPAAAEPPKAVSRPVRGRGRGLLKAKVTGTTPGESFSDSWDTGTSDPSNGFSRDNDFSAPSNGFSRGGGSRTCHKCNEEGHMARDCPNASAPLCRKCNQPGHFARECPEGDSGGGGDRTCRRCNEAGHIARDCPQADTRTCHKCNQPGHLARDCTEEPSGDGPSGDGPGPSTYIPQDYNDEDDLIVKAGINFDNYDRIDVEVTGRNKPKFITSFKEANLHPQLLENIPREFTKPTPVQKYAIPIVQAGRDLMACSMTGSGKTAAFLLPIIDNLLKEEEAPPLSNSITVFPRALIVGPTRELVLQTYQWSEKFTKNTEINGRKLYGKLQTGYLKNHIRSGGGAHIISATPGRLKDFLEKGWISFNFLKYVVLDEADRMLDMGFAPDIEEIFSRMTSDDPKQVLMFSATFPKEVQQMASKYCQDYLFLAVGIVGAACSDVEQQIVLVESPDDDGDIKNKDDCLRDILMSVRDGSGRMTRKVLVFVEQKKKADCLGMELCELGFSATTIHGDREQPEREEALRTFKRGKHMLLVATSVAARGLDIPEVDYVVNYNIPSDIDSYVHRIGRTGRCGNKGKAISFYDPSSDSGLANFLVDQLQKANQQVPAFLQKDVGYGGTGSRQGQSRDIRRNVPRSRHNFGQGGHDQNFDDEPDNFMSGGKNYETEPSWGNGGGEVAAQDNDDDGW